MQGEYKPVLHIQLVSLTPPRRIATSALPASALDEPESDDEEEVTGVERDDERSGTKYNVSVPVYIPQDRRVRS
jgi:hypothetical protein